MMIICLIYHKSILDDNPIEEMFSKLETTHSWSASARSLTQRCINRKEMSYFIIFLLYVSLLFYNMCGWIASQILDNITLRGQLNIYFRIHIVCNINDLLRNILLTNQFGVLIFNTVVACLLNFMLLRRLRKSAAMAYKIHKNDIITTFIYALISMLLLSTFIVPFSDKKHNLHALHNLATDKNSIVWPLLDVI